MLPFILTLYLSVLVHMWRHLFSISLLSYSCTCLIKTAYNCWEKCIHTDHNMVPWLCILVIFTQCGCLCSEMRDSRGQDCMPISDWISSCLLSVISHVLGKSSGSAASDKTDRKPHTWFCHWQVPLKQKVNEASLFPFSAPDNSKEFPLAADSVHLIQIFELFWSLHRYADCLVGEYFNHGRLRSFLFSFPF